MHESSKLTLRLNKKIIDFAKHYSQEQGKSVSQMVNDYFTLLADQKQIEPHFVDTPITHSLTGILKKSKVSEKDYKKHLKSKYL